MTRPETPETDPATATPESATPDTPQEEAPASPSFGWNAYAERLNGRFAMVGFVALLVLELITRQDFFTWLGL
jgi:hypothetical protein